MLPLPFHRSLSARLLLLTILFVMLAEVLIFAPSVARFRLGWLQQRLAEAHLAALTIEAAPDLMVNEELAAKLLDYVGAHAVDLAQPDKRVYMLGRRRPPPVAAVVDLRQINIPDLMVDAIAVMGRTEPRVIRVIGISPRRPDVVVEALLDEAPLRAEMIDFGGRIFLLSLAISVISAILVFFTLQRLLVHPMQQITRSIIAFRRDPEDPAAITALAGPRNDEIGMTQRALAEMQEAVRTSLRQKERLATLGTAVAKINHDLRSILATATLVWEHLAASSADPEVRRITPRLMTALDRAVDLCTQTLSYTRDGVLPLECQPFALDALVQEVGVEGIATDRRSLSGEPAWQWRNEVPAGVTVRADRDQLFRALANLARNAVQAGARTVTVSAETSPGRITLTVADDGPGLPRQARDHLFRPFAGSGRGGGSGLGLVIAREVARAHGGDLRLQRSDAEGTAFVLDLPADGIAAPAADDGPS